MAQEAGPLWFHNLVSLAGNLQGHAREESGPKRAFHWGEAAAAAAAAAGNRGSFSG